MIELSDRKQTEIFGLSPKPTSNDMESEKIFTRESSYKK
jgi:hypothetical protein